MYMHHPERSEGLEWGGVRVFIREHWV